MKNKLKNLKWWQWLLLPFTWGGPLGMIITFLVILIIWGIWKLS